MPGMGRFIGVSLGIFLGLAGSGASALTLESFPGPVGSPNALDSDENLRVAPLNAPSDPLSGLKNPRSGFSFGFSGSSGGGYPSGNRQFIPGYSVPGQYGPAIDPQTKEPYPGR
jgi:hypothetical protein